MEKRVIIVGAQGFWNVRHRVRDILPPDIRLHRDESLTIDGGEWPHVLALIVNDQVIDPCLMDRYPNMKVIARTGTGYDAVDVAEARKRGIVVTRVAKVNAEGTAEFGIAMLFALMKNLTPLHVGMLKGEWLHASGPLYGAHLPDMTVGIVGLGHVGRAVSRRLHALETGRILGWNRTERSEISTLCKGLRLELVSLEELFKTSDAVILTISLTSETEGMVSANVLASMKPTAYLVNICRGAVVDEDALAQAVAECKLGGVALDVFSSEPPPDWTLFEKPFMRSLVASAEMGRNVILTPHNASRTKNIVLNTSIQVARNIAGVLSGNLDGVEIVE